VARLHPHPNVGEIRQRGLMCGIELVADAPTKKPFAQSDRAGARVCRAARDEGLVIRPLGDTIVIMPALAMTAEQVRFLVDVLQRCITAVLG